MICLLSFKSDSEGEELSNFSPTLTPLKCRASPEATAPHTVLSFPPFTVSQFWLEGARLKLSLSWTGREVSGSSQYRPPHCSSQLGVEREKGRVNIKHSPCENSHITEANFFLGQHDERLLLFTVTKLAKDHLLSLTTPEASDRL